jgi:hypothetical protein
MMGCCCSTAANGWASEHVACVTGPVLLWHCCKQGGGGSEAQGGFKAYRSVPSASMGGGVQQVRRV